ncbi:MAG: MBL fold metallo-hydrolase [bacterium]|nr:MBL fold metallo-hydrolase [bacterium]
MKITFWGCRGSCPGAVHEQKHHGGNTTCISVDLGSEALIVLDAGTGIRNLGKEILEKSRPIYLLLTHVHWDHIQGFPFFDPIFNPEQNIFLYSPDGKEAVRRLLWQMDGTYFPVTHNEICATLTPLKTPWFMESVFQGSLDSIQTNHPGKCFAYRLTHEEKSVVLIPDNQLHKTRPDHKDMSEFIEFCRDADVLVHDAQFRKKDMPLKEDWGHSILEDVITLAHTANVKTLVLFHHDPDRTDMELESDVKTVNNALKKLGSKTQCVAAADGLTIEP